MYYIVLKPISFLPFSLLYPISDAMFIVIYRLVGYRKSVVFRNISNSFPEKTKEEVLQIQEGFYRHLCDVIVESIKLFSISKKDLMNRFAIKNSELLQQYFESGKNVILVGGHYNNWEIAGKGFDLNLQHQAVGIYSPMRDKFFERKINESRTQFGVEIVAKANVPRAFVATRDRTTVTIFGADQSPTYSKQVHWMNFLNQETAVHIGTEIFAMKYNYPVIFFQIHKQKRGFYEGVLETVSENPSDMRKGEITELHTRCLEKQINEDPQYWLWSHNRWKRKMNDEERMQYKDRAEYPAA